MARRKQTEELENDPTDAPEAEAFAPSPQELGPLAEEVQSFLDRRGELARKLAAEIEATERKLAELRRTAAALFPEGPAEEERDRPERKPRKSAKVMKIAEEEAPEVADEEPAPVDQPTEQPAGEQGEAPAVADDDGPVVQVA
jgi:hypothetical protein